MAADARDNQGTAASSIKITVAKPFQWRAYQAIRLEALAREPAAFSSTFADTVAWPDAYWMQRLESGSIVLLAWRGREPVAMAGAFAGPNDGGPAVAVIFGVYVRASERGAGLGRRLMAELFAQITARFPETRTLRLWVTPTQAAARALYRALGFQEAPNLDDDAVGEIMLERPLRP